MRQAEEISKDIWKLAKQEISCACPFFAHLLEKIEILGQNERKSYGLDGFRMWYEPFELLNTYQEQGRKKSIVCFYTACFIFCICIWQKKSGRKHAGIWHVI